MSSCKDISFYLYAETLMNRLQSIGNSVEPYTKRAKGENDVQQDIINVQQDIQEMTKLATTEGKHVGHTVIPLDLVKKFARDVHKLGVDAKALYAFQEANPGLDDGLGKQALSTYNMIMGTGSNGGKGGGHEFESKYTYKDQNGNTVKVDADNTIHSIGNAIRAALKDGNPYPLQADLQALGNYYYEQKYMVSSSSAPADLGPLDDWVNNGYKGGVSTSALDTNLGAAVNTNNNQLNTWSTLIQQLDQVAQNVITSLSSLWGTEVSNTRSSGS